MPKPNKVGDYTLTFRVDEDLLVWIDRHAQESVRSRAQEIEYLIRLGVKEVERSAEMATPSQAELEALVKRLIRSEG